MIKIRPPTERWNNMTGSETTLILSSEFDPMERGMNEKNQKSSGMREGRLGN